MTLTSNSNLFDLATLATDQTTGSVHKHATNPRNYFATKQAKIAIVDDEELNIEVVQGYLEQEGYSNFCRTTDATQAVPLIATECPDVVLLDVMMPNVSGLEVLSAMRQRPDLRHIPAIILTANTSTETKFEALNLGASDFLGKPVDPSELLLRLRNVLATKAHHDYLEDQSVSLEQRVAQRTEELVESRRQIIHCLARAADFRDDDTGDHVVRVGKYAAIIATELGFEPHAVDLIEQAAKLHDIGKIGIPDRILLKKGKLESSEFDLMREHCGYGTSIIFPQSADELDQAYGRHTDVGAKLLDVDGFPVLELAATVALTHHEKWDGSGYPRGLKGLEIPIEGRITAVADVFDALSSERPYKKAMSLEKSCQILHEGRDTHFDGRILDAFFARIAEVAAVKSNA